MHAYLGFFQFVFTLIYFCLFFAIFCDLLFNFLYIFLGFFLIFFFFCDLLLLFLLIFLWLASSFFAFFLSSRIFLIFCVFLLNYIFIINCPFSTIFFLVFPFFSDCFKTLHFTSTLRRSWSLFQFINKYHFKKKTVN